jgi:predicted deacylase
MTETSIPTTPDTVYESVYVTTLADGHELRIPVHRKIGATPGPTLGIVALLHGDETLPNELVRLVLARLDAQELRGEVIALPASYPVAFGALTRNSPIDMLDLNRSFPGDPAGWLTEQVAHALAEFLLPKIDVLVDLHSGGLLATVDYVYAAHQARELAVALGREHTYLTPSPHPGGLLGVAAARGIPAAILELGGGYHAEEQLIEPGVAAIENVLRHLGMIDGPPVVAQEQIVFTELATLRPRAGGILHPGVRSERLGTVISQGELLGSVVSSSTFEVLERFYSPYEEGRLLLLRPALGRINPGDFAYMIGNVASEERA